MMPADPQRTLPSLAAALHTAKGPLEQEFARAAEALANSSGLLDQIMGSFETLVAELDSPALKGATEDLARVARQMPEFARAIEAQRHSLRHIRELLATVSLSLDHMAATIRVVGILAVNARIEAAAIGEKAAEFVVFTEEVFRVFEASRNNLERFRHDLDALDAMLEARLAEVDGIEARETEAIEALPRWLAESVAAVVRRRGVGAKASGNIRRRSAQVRTRVGEAIMALQIADSTRQRIEHVIETLEATTGLLGKPGQPLEPERKRLLVSHIARLQAAQLQQADQAFEADAERVTRALHGLVTDTRDIGRLGAESWQSEGGGGFLGQIEGNVREAGRMLQTFQAAHADASRIAGEIACAVGGLVAQIAVVRGLEAELQLMGLNMVLRSNRLGDGGRVLRVVAQELRLCADETTVSASAISHGLAEVEQAARFIARRDGRPVDHAADPGPMAQVMRDALACLVATGTSITASLAGLERDGEAAAAALDTAAGHIEHAKIGQILYQVRTGLETLAPGLPATPAELRQIEDLLPVALRGSYTMASERAIHQAMSGSPTGPATGPAPAMAEAIDDLLF